MRSLKTLLLAGVIASIPTVASAQWYVGADAGINFGSDTKLNTFGERVSAGRGVGFTGIVQGGYAFAGSSVGTPKVELEGGYRYVNYDSVKIGGIRSRMAGNANVATIMLNGVYEFMPASSWHPFLGVGVGTAYLDYGDNLNEWTFVYQGLVGVAYDFNKKLSGKLQYRYLGTADKTKTTVDNERVSASQFSDHSILVGWAYKFN